MPEHPLRRRAILVGLLLGAALLVRLGASQSALWIGRSLICRERLIPSDAIVIENFNPEYLLFERAAAIQKAGLAQAVFVPGEASGKFDEPNTVSAGIVEVMARVARVKHVTFVTTRQQEPISLNAAEQMKSFLSGRGIRSVLWITQGFRSRRMQLVNERVLGEAGITVNCVPVFGDSATRDSWSSTWHGRQNVFEQWGKLLYYRLYVLPFSRRTASAHFVPTGREIWPN